MGHDVGQLSHGQDKSDGATRTLAMKRSSFVKVSFFEIHLEPLLSSGTWEGLVDYIFLWDGGSEKVALRETYGQFITDRNVGFYSGDWADKRVRVSANTKYIGGAITKCFPADLIEKDAIIWRET